MFSPCYPDEVWRVPSLNFLDLIFVTKLFKALSDQEWKSCSWFSLKNSFVFNSGFFLSKSLRVSSKLNFSENFWSHLTNFFAVFRIHIILIWIRIQGNFWFCESDFPYLSLIYYVNIKLLKIILKNFRHVKCK